MDGPHQNSHPIIHIRLHSDYQASIKGLAPDVTVTVNVPSLPLDDAALAEAIVKARIAAIDEFKRSLEEAWPELKRINKELGK